jgi:hypothetical protein
MSDETYNRALQAALDEQATLLNLRAKTDNRLAQLEQMIESLVPLCDENYIGASVVPAPPMSFAGKGLADACRLVLQAEGRFMTPIAIRDALRKGGYDEAKQSNLLASIHSICKRLVDSHEAEQQIVGGKTFYRWQGRNASLAEALRRFAPPPGSTFKSSVPTREDSIKKS